MTEAATLQSLQPVAPAQPLVCRLRRKQAIHRGTSVPYMGEVELENLSPTPVEIAYRMTVLQYLNLVVTSSDGTVVSEGYFGDRFAPTLEPQVLRLEPGGQFAANVHLFATMPHSSIPPGSYVVQAVYEYDGFRAISDPLLVPVTLQEAPAVLSSGQGVLP
jgi:hypothetical protein